MAQAAFKHAEDLESSSSALTLDRIYNEYRIIEIKLAMSAEITPVSSDVCDADVLATMSLLDRQVALLNTALEQKAYTMDDARVLMKLWEAEVVQGRDISDLSAANALVKSIFDLMVSL